MKVTQSQFIEQLAVKMGVPVSAADQFVSAFKALIYSTLAAGDAVEFSGFGQFKVSARAARQGVNPRQPSVRITIPALNTPKFKAGEAFKQAVALKN
jgi:DNA-binding protein HU-beta